MIAVAVFVVAHLAVVGILYNSGDLHMKPLLLLVQFQLADLIKKLILLHDAWSDDERVYQRSHIGIEHAKH